MSLDNDSPKTEPRQLAEKGVALEKRYRSTLSPNKLDDELARFAQDNSDMLIGLEFHIHHLQSQMSVLTGRLKALDPTFCDI